MWYLWGALIGLALALVFLLVFYKVFYPGLARDAQLATIDPGTLQQSNIDTLQAEIDAYKAALAGDVCLAPPLADSAPLFRPRGGPEGGADGGTAAGDGASRSVPGMPPPVNPEAGDAVEAATVLVLAQGTDGTGHGTGFFINDRQVLTNRHVVEDAMDGGTVHVTSKALGTAVPARVVAITPDTEVRDYAVLEIAQPVPHGKLKLQSQAQRRERVGAYGYPILDVRSDPAMQSFLNEGTFTGAPEVIFTDGVISVIHRGQGTPSIINHTADVSQGNSGGPLVNAAGDVLGINTKIRLDQKSNRQVNMSLGADDIMQFLRSNGISFDVAGSA
jgi:S1-C subfamily serine protease